MTSRGEKNEKNKELQEKAAGGWRKEERERDASSETISGDLTLWLSARRHKSQIGRTHTDTHGQMKAPPRAMKVTPWDVDNGSQ